MVGRVRKAVVGWGLVLAAMASGCSTSSQMTSVAAAPGEWGSTYAFTDGRQVVEVSPGIGRVVRFSLKGEKNLLWTDATAPFDTFKTFINYGGDKLWSWPQEAWSWPPPPELDAGPYRFNTRSSPGYLAFQLTSDHVTKAGLNGMRTTELHAEGVRSIYQLKATRDVPKAAAWSVVQVLPPDAVYVRLLPNAADPVARPMNEFPTESVRLNERWVKVTPRFNSGKVGFPGDLLAARWGDRVLVVRRTAGNDDPGLERGVAAQLYFHGLPKGANAPDQTTYVELELIGPTKAMKADDIVTLETDWQILTGAELDRLMKE